MIVKPRLYDTTCCQSGCQIGLTTMQLYRVYKHSTGCQTRLTTGLTNGCIVYTAGCHNGCTTRFHNRLNEKWLFVQRSTRLNVQRSTRLNEQWMSNRLSNNQLDVCLHDTARCHTGCTTTGLTTGCIV